MPAERVAMRHVREILRLKFSSRIAGRESARALARRYLLNAVRLHAGIAFAADSETPSSARIPP